MAWILLNEKFSDTFIAFSAMSIFIGAIFYCAWLEQKYRAIKGFIKRHGKYS